MPASILGLGIPNPACRWYVPAPILGPGPPNPESSLQIACACPDSWYSPPHPQIQPVLALSSPPGRGESNKWEQGEVPQMAGVGHGPAAGDPLALPLVESVQLIGIITHTPLFGIQILPLIKLVPWVFPVRVQSLRSTNSKSVRRVPSPPLALFCLLLPSCREQVFPGTV